MRLASAAALLALALPWAFAPTAGAHLSVTPPFLTAGETGSLVLTVHNDRPETMTGFELTVPSGFRIASIGTATEWSGEVEGRTARWRGGALAADTPMSFELAVRVPAATGPATLEGNQLYPGGVTVGWPVTLTVVPGGAAGNGSLPDRTSAIALAVLTLLVLVTVALVVRRRRSTNV